MAMSLLNFPLEKMFFNQNHQANNNTLAGFGKELQQMQNNAMQGLGAMDVKESDNCWTVNLDTPGVLESDITIQKEGNVLSISGERKSEKKDTETGYYERSYGKFGRSFTIGDNCEVDNITAKLEHGVLHIHIPKKPKEEPAPVVTTIPIAFRTRGRSKSPEAPESDAKLDAKSTSSAGKKPHHKHHHETPSRVSLRHLGLRPEHQRRSASEEFGKEFVDK
eukprot:m.255852 g.255852  ORF g.255852 m.255852 type:complete len:221 (+) comp33954_c0_seq1:297-959(+)